MNAFVTETTGYMPMYLKDFEFIFDCMAQLSAGFSSIFGDNYILSGCVSDTNSVSAGFVVINGELCLHKGTDFETFIGGLTIYFGIEETLLSKSERQFELPDNNVAVHRVWKQRVAIAYTDSGIGRVRMTRRADRMIGKITTHNHDALYMRHVSSLTVVEGIDLKSSIYDAYNMFVVPASCTNRVEIILPLIKNNSRKKNWIFINKSDQLMELHNPYKDQRETILQKQRVELNVIDNSYCYSFSSISIMEKS